MTANLKIVPDPDPATGRESRPSTHSKTRRVTLAGPPVPECEPTRSVKFAIPANEHETLKLLQLQFFWQHKRVRKSQLLRAAVHLLNTMPLPELLAAISALKTNER